MLHTKIIIQIAFACFISNPVEAQVLYEIKHRKLDYFGHVMRNDKYRLLQLAMEGKIEGKRGQGRKEIRGSKISGTGLVSIP